MQGLSPETSGGLLIVMNRNDANAFCNELFAIEGYPAWIVGFVKDGNRSAHIDNNIQITSAPTTELTNDSIW
jgi:selenide,water dikinase